MYSFRKSRCMVRENSEMAKIWPFVAKIWPFLAKNDTSESFWHITSKRYHKTYQFFSMKVFLMFFFEKIILYMLEKFWYGQNLIICGPNSTIFYCNWHFLKLLTYNFQILLWNFPIFMWKLSLWSFFRKS